ncbi:MAG TPA: nucleotidyltransferase domain-containing protein [Candidatus Sulfotelmatobacter sp.]|nr:nucleotidyltransferase domain-containing protein [Candidatus Sulfotelmatobacter sp.]
MIPQDTIDEFVRRVREAGGSNVEGVILFGSAAAGDFHEGLSNVNLMCILRDTSLKALHALSPAAKWWDGKKQTPPLCMTKQELQRSTDVFTIELLDMQQHHRVLFGDDPLKDLQIPMDLHRVQVEYELREKLILLRQHLMLADANEARLWEVVLRSVSSLSTLFRHTLIALGESASTSRREAVAALAQRVGFDGGSILKVLDVREGKADRKKIDIVDLAARYLSSVEKVIAAVDMASA